MSEELPRDDGTTPGAVRQSPPARVDRTLEYAGPGPRISILALVSMAFGITSIALSVAGPVAPIGVLLAILAGVMGFIAQMHIDGNPQRLAGTGYAYVGVGTCIVAILLFMLFVPSLGRNHVLSPRTTCGANLTGIMKAMLVYASDNNDAFPTIAPIGGYGLTAMGGGKPNVDPEATVRSLYTSPSEPSVPQNVWLLVASGAVSPKQFICKSDNFAKPAAERTSAGMCFTNFNDGKKISDFGYSYSFAYPWTAAAGTAPDGTVIPAGSVGGWWRNTMDAGLPLMADMAPLAGTGKPAATPGDGRSANGNSFNHARTGQNVAFGDAHAEFVRVPGVGHGGDNIYAGSGGKPNIIGTQRAGVVPDIGDGVAAGAWDVCLVPAADGKTGVRK
jgi:hypothetical protein